MGLVLDKCCCSNDSKIKEGEDFMPPEMPKPLPQIINARYNPTSN
jgi:hypothetical protein